MEAGRFCDAGTEPFAWVEADVPGPGDEVGGFSMTKVWQLESR